MPTKDGFQQSYNAQVGVETHSRLIVGARVSQAPNDKPELAADVAAWQRQPHGRTVAQLEQRADPPAPGPHAPFAEHLRHRTATAKGRARYALRQQTVEPVFGIIKEALGFRRFSLRGLAKVALEWDLVCLAYNLKRLHTLGARPAAAPAGPVFSSLPVQLALNGEP